MIYELLVNVLFVTDSPIDGKPCDELECCGPFVVFVLVRPSFVHQNRLIAIKTCIGSREKKDDFTFNLQFSFLKFSQISVQAIHHPRNDE